MRLIKLDAIDSTNDFLKKLSQQEQLENFTVVTAENQTKGKGQMGSVWNSEISKNLIMSVLIKDLLSDVNSIFVLNICVALSVLEVLERWKIPFLSIKWPNDIMSHDKKIGGILIENSIRSDGSIFSIVGLGLNVNQENFENLPKASSLALISGKIFDKEILLKEIIDTLERKIPRIQHSAEALWESYSQNLFRFGKPTAFENSSTKKQFMGIINGVEADGKIAIKVEDDSVLTFGIKEIQMLY